MNVLWVYSPFYNWLSNRNIIEFHGIWERLMNPNFNCAEFDIIKSQAGLNRFRLSAKAWTEKTNAISQSSLSFCLVVVRMAVAILNFSWRFFAIDSSN